ncbi:hypothetical protein HDV05_007837 [Chytridiales sp. JEL 0842]|nr:hypothetical protein HDV05_007837 [Chytridiales sp. JEL 0842]
MSTPISTSTTSTGQTSPHSSRRIVVALDSSTHSQFALAWTLENLTRTGDHIILLSVGVFPGTWGDYLSVAFQGPVFNAERVEGLKQQAEEFALKSLMEASKIIQEHITGQDQDSFCISHEILAYTKGTISPADVIISTCEAQDADLCVVGSRGLGGLKRVVLGSVSEYVAQHCCCPVVIVREVHGGRGLGGVKRKTGETTNTRTVEVEDLQTEAVETRMPMVGGFAGNEGENEQDDDEVGARTTRVRSASGGLHSPTSEGPGTSRAGKERGGSRDEGVLIEE